MKNTGYVGRPRNDGRMQYEDIDALRRNHPAWRLLSAGNAPLVLSFLRNVFIDDNVREISATDLTNRLDDELYALNQRLGEDTAPKSAKDYIADWCAGDTRWLRKYYVEGSDEAHYDATGAVERAVSWVESLRAREFVATESRLNTVFDLLRQIVHGSDADPEARLAELRRRRHEIDLQIAATELGNFQILDDTGRRDRYQQFTETARTILSDFREVEANLRDLDSAMREKIATWSGTKADLLDEFVGTRAGIGDSDQGRSLQAFYDLLLSADRLDELTGLIATATARDGEGTSDRLTRIHYDWLAAARRAQTIVARLSEQLRGFLDDQVWLDHRRIMDLIHDIETTAVTTRDDPASQAFTVPIDALAPEISLPMERPLYARPVPVEIDSAGIVTGQVQDLSVTLYQQDQVDPAPLRATIRARLRRTGQTTLAEVLDAAPLQHGLEELVTYFALGGDGSFDTVFDDSVTDTVAWTRPDGARRTACLPRVIYARAGQDRDLP